MTIVHSLGCNEVIRLAHDETPFPFDSFKHQEGHYLGLVDKLECQLLDPIDHGRLARDETPYPF